jgi:hypothetical protein
LRDNLDGKIWRRGEVDFAHGPWLAQVVSALIVAARQSAMVLVVARAGGLPGPDCRAIAVRLR